MDSAWMNWEGWRFVAPALGVAVGIFIGWDARGFRTRLDINLLQYRLLRLGFAARKVLANPHTDETLICFVELKEAADAAFEEKP